jgi:hypothetical protein
VAVKPSISRQIINDTKDIYWNFGIGCISTLKQKLNVSLLVKTYHIIQRSKKWDLFGKFGTLSREQCFSTKPFVLWEFIEGTQKPR